MSAVSLTPSFTSVRSGWSSADRWGAIRCRVGRFRMRYAVAPGLYALGKPDMHSPVFVSANYKLSFDLLRRSLSGRDGWILALDTKGINVWCAAGRGTFGTEELIERVRVTDLEGAVRHRTLILPQLGAPGVQSHIVERSTGFRVEFGPIRARDLPQYLDSGRSATPEMRKVTFSASERLALAPMEVGQSLMRFPAFALAAFLIAGLSRNGVVIADAWEGAWPLLLLGLGAIAAGSFLVPLLLPYIPLRAFTAKGWIMGGLVTALLLHGARLASRMDPYLIAACYLFFPAASAFMALNFTGATTFTSLSGVRREIRISLPFSIAAGALALAALVFSKLFLWGVI